MRNLGFYNFASKILIIIYMSFKKIYLFFRLLLTFSFILIACKKDEFKKINQLIPKKIIESVSEHMPIYEGNTPPNIQGNYLISPCILLFCSTNPDLEYTFEDYTFKFYNQKEKNNYNIVSFVGNHKLMRIDSCDNIFLVGSDNNFTAYYTIKEHHYSGINYKAAVIISGTKIKNGLSNTFIAIIILNKSQGLNDELVLAEKSFRIIKDKDNLTELTDTIVTSKKQLFNY
ncbi:MAG TPA: hypothetical protein PKX15_01265 [Bacteroidales bacterium]|nr:hypothetical protein [Bacteroidales bacterium]